MAREPQKEPKKPNLIFNADPAEQTDGEHLSLRAYIAEHIRKKAKETGGDREIEVFNPYQKLLSTRQTPGSHINKLDVDFGEGLEHLLPTPATRYKVIKSRLTAEIADVENRLNRYRAIAHPSPEIQSQVTALKERLAVLQRHDAEVSGTLAQMYANGSAAVQFGQWQEGFNQWIGGLTVGLMNECGKLLQQAGIGGHSGEIRELCRQIAEIQSVLAEEIRRPGVTPSELSQLITESDHKIRQLEARAVQLRAQGWKSRFLPEKTQ